MNKIFFILILIVQNIFSNTQSILDSQPEIIFKYKNIKKAQQKLKLKVDFNKAVLLLEE
jgi:hypothetical protein